ncbi:ribonuclease HII [Peribacillus asahii]|uniref:ribonuclease HII n=1 Tax=Peribacillus asahii TaxID=228899 RepID=UPI003F4C5794
MNITGENMDTRMSIKEIALKLQEITNPNDDFFIQCQHDERKGVINLVKKWERSFEKEQQLKQHFITMSQYERELRKQGFALIAGIDEVGRGPLAGPVVASAVMLPETFYLPGLNDSKKIPEIKRELFYETIMQEAIAVGIGIVDNEEIDAINIYQATKKAMITAISELREQPNHLLIDAMELEVDIPQYSIIKGDAKSISISAASIIAKVTRDRMMKEYAKQYPEYGFEHNMGYGTSVHLEALSRYGLTPWHRKSFSPIKEMIHRG